MSHASSTRLSFAIFHKSQQMWFASLFIAQVIFVIYLAAGYGASLFSNNIAQWNQFNPTAYVSSDPVGNTMYGMHVLLAMVMIIGGSLQFIPSIRSRFSRFHRYNGRVFVLFACIISLAGMYLIVVRGTVGNTLMHSLTASSGVIVLVSSYFVIKTARRRQFLQHQQWVLHLFVAANGVLFFRLCLFAWMMLFGTMGINTKDFTGPTVVALSALCYVGAHVILLAIRFANKTRFNFIRFILGAMLAVISAVFLLGLFGIVMASWYPAVTA